MNNIIPSILINNYVSENTNANSKIPCYSNNFNIPNDQYINISNKSLAKPTTRKNSFKGAFNTLVASFKGSQSKSELQMLDDEIAKIQKGEMGIVRGPDELTVKDVMTVIKHQLMPITSEDIDEIINSLSGEDRGLALKILDRMTQYGNMKKIDHLAHELGKRSISYDDKPSLGSIMHYLNSKKALSNKDIEFKHSDFDGETNILLDEMTLERLENDHEFLEKIRNNPEIRLIYLEGWINGINPFNHTTIKDIEPQLKKYLEQVKERISKDPDAVNMSIDEHISNVLKEPIKEQLRDLGINDKLSVLHDGEGIWWPATIEDIAENLKPASITESQLNGILKKFPAEYRQNILELLAHSINVLSPRSMGVKLKELHQKIIDTNGGTDKGIYYYVPDIHKSYGLITLQYANINNIPSDKILTPEDVENKRIPSGTKKIVILDDVAASGSSLSDCFNDLAVELGKFYNNVDEIIPTSLMSTYWANKVITEPIDEKFSEGMPIFEKIKKFKGTSTHLSLEEVLNFDETEYYRSLPREEKEKMWKLMGRYGPCETALCISTPYIGIDNNYLFANREISKHFTLNGAGIRNFNDFGADSRFENLMDQAKKEAEIEARLVA